MKEPAIYPAAEGVAEVPMVEEPVALFGHVDNREQVIRKIKKGLPASSFA